MAQDTTYDDPDLSKAMGGGDTADTTPAPVSDKGMGDIVKGEPPTTKAASKPGAGSSDEPKTFGEAFRKAYAQGAGTEFTWKGEKKVALKAGDKGADRLTKRVIKVPPPTASKDKPTLTARKDTSSKPAPKPSPAPKVAPKPASSPLGDGTLFKSKPLPFGATSPADAIAGPALRGMQARAMELRKSGGQSWNAKKGDPGLTRLAKGGGIEVRGKTKAKGFAKGGTIDGCAVRGKTKARRK